MSPLRILIAGYDSGGLNLLAPLLRAWSADPHFAPEFLSTPVICRDLVYSVPSLRLAHRTSELDEWMCHRPNELDRFLPSVIAEGGYDAVVCATSGSVSLERRLFIAARARGIPSAAFCDMWCAYTLRFQEGNDWCLPDRLWVIDEAMRKQFLSENSKLSPPIDVIGSPLYESLLRQRQKSIDSEGQAIRFVSDPASTKFPDARLDEFALAEWVVAAAREIGSVRRIVIRPHPLDSMESWRRWIFSRRDFGVGLDALPLQEAIKDSWVAVGLSSILLTEMRMCGVPAASLQPTESDPGYFCIPFESLGIARVENQASLKKWLTQPTNSMPTAAASFHLNATRNATESLHRLSLRSCPQMRPAAR